ncbi:MAG: putative toxin-antitoxin system toxin component, PIN family [Cyclobacteriaceae bacterium]
MKVFADSNFLISALATRGLSAELLEILLTSDKLCVSLQVHSEVLEKLERKFKLPTDHIKEASTFLTSLVLAPNPTKIHYQLGDQDDEAILSAAIEFDCAYFVTGDKDLLAVAEQVIELKIITPRELWVLLKS